MNYLVYFVLTLLLTRTVGPTGIEQDRVQKLFEIMQTHFAEVSERRNQSSILHLSFTLLARDPARFCPDDEEFGKVDQAKDWH